MYAVVYQYMMTSSYETFSALLANCDGNPPATGGFPSQRAVTESFDVLFHLRLNKRLSKQIVGDLKRHRAHYDVTVMVNPTLQPHAIHNVYLLNCSPSSSATNPPFKAKIYLNCNIKFSFTGSVFSLSLCDSNTYASWQSWWRWAFTQLLFGVLKVGYPPGKTNLYKISTINASLFR